MTPNDPHAGVVVSQAGPGIKDARGAVVLLHGRGGSADDILSLGRAISPKGWAILAPEATNHSWYPYSFLAPREHNEPFLTSALSLVRRIVVSLSAEGLPAARVAICGFSQGACLATEYVGLTPQRFAALIGFTGGLIGPPDALLELSGDLSETPILLSSGDPDPHVPWARVQQTASMMEQIGGRVTLSRYAGRPHTVTSEEIEEARQLLATI